MHARRATRRERRGAHLDLRIQHANAQLSRCGRGAHDHQLKFPQRTRQRVNPKAQLVPTNSKSSKPERSEASRPTSDPTAVTMKRKKTAT